MLTPPARAQQAGGDEARAVAGAREARSQRLSRRHPARRAGDRRRPRRDRGQRRGARVPRSVPAGSSSLSIDETPITDAGLAHLEHLNQLADLSLDHTAIGDAGVAHLPTIGEPPQADAGPREITDAGLAHLKDLQRLETLSLIGTKITDAGLEHLEGLQRLEWLLLDGNAITDAGLVHLKGLRNLEYLLLNKTAVTDEGLRQLTGLKESRCSRSTAPPSPTPAWRLSRRHCPRPRSIIDQNGEHPAAVAGRPGRDYQPRVADAHSVRRRPSIRHDRDDRSEPAGPTPDRRHSLRFPDFPCSPGVL